MRPPHLIIVLTMIILVACGQESEAPAQAPQVITNPPSDTTTIPETAAQPEHQHDPVVTDESAAPAQVDVTLIPSPTPPAAAVHTTAYLGPTPEGALARLGRGPFREIILSPDGQQLAVGGDLGVFIYRTDTLEQMWFHPMPDGALAIHAITFTPDGTRLGIGYFPIPLTTVFDAETGSELFSVEGHSMGICAVAFSRDSTRVATGSYDDKVMIWDSTTGEHLQTIDGNGSGINGLAYSLDGQYLIVGLDSNSVWALDATTGQWQQSLWAGSDLAYNVAISPDGSQILSGSIHGAILWDAVGWQYQGFLDGLDGNAPNLAFSPDGRWMAAGSIGDIARIWDRATLEPVWTFNAQSVTFPELTTGFAAGSRDGTITLWQDVTDTNPRMLIGHTGYSLHTAVSADGTRMAAVMTNGRIILWNGDNQQPITDFRLAPDTVTSIALNTNGTLLAVGMKDGAVQIYRLDNTGSHTYLDGHGDEVISLAFSPDGTRLASGAEDGQIIVWDLAAGAAFYTATGHADSSKGVMFSPDGSLLAVANGTFLQLHNAATGEIVLNLNAITEHINSATFSHDGSRVAAGTHEGLVIVWEAATGNHITTLDGSRPEALSIAFSPDGTRLASGWEDGTLLVWDIASGVPIGSLNGHTLPVRSVMYLSSGIVATGSEDGTIVLWNP